MLLWIFKCPCLIFSDSNYNNPWTKLGHPII